MLGETGILMAGTAKMRQAGDTGAARAIAANRSAGREIAMPETIRFPGLELRFLQNKEETDGSLDVFEMTVQPAARMPVPHYHESWDETVYGLAGTLTWRVDGRDIAVGPGESVFIRRGIVHGFRNDGQAAATCLCILSPGVLGSGYFREIEALVAQGAPDPAAMKAIMLRHGLVPAPPA
jgi:quercetin dioxygenase-like cupin family protein